MRERGHMEDPGLDGMKILGLIFRKLDEGMDWIGLARERDRWPTFVTAVMNLRVL